MLVPADYLRTLVSPPEPPSAPFIVFKTVTSIVVLVSSYLLAIWAWCKLEQLQQGFQEKGLLEAEWIKEGGREDGDEDKGDDWDTILDASQDEEGDEDEEDVERGRTRVKTSNVPPRNSAMRAKNRGKKLGTGDQHLQHRRQHQKRSQKP